jgi:hypothetical protein
MVMTVWSVDKWYYIEKMVKPAGGEKQIRVEEHEEKRKETSTKNYEDC